MGNFHSIRRAKNKPLIFYKILTSISLSLLFVIIYGFCNKITALRSDVGMYYFEWEKLIPFIPIFIIPYMSIDLFFAAAPFLCNSSGELKLFAKRISAVIIIAGIFFLFMPLKFAFPRPETTGFLGAVFNFLYGFDQPYNMFPSMHIALRTVLAELYARKTRGIARILSNIWFSLIGFSTVFTYQHHIIDIIGGFILALLILYFIREKKEKFSMIKNKRIGYYYIFLFLIFALAAFYNIFFAWLAFAMLLVASAYLKYGVTVFRKENGTIALSAKVILFPYFFAQKIYLYSYRKKCDAWNEIIPNLWLGKKLSNREAEAAIRNGVAAAVDLTAEFSEPENFLKLNYLNIQTLDLTAPTQENINLAVSFIEENIKNGIVYVHCKIGYSRSAVIVAAYLIKSGTAKTVLEAVGIIKQRRPSLIIRDEAKTALEKYFVIKKQNARRAKNSQRF